MSTARTDAPTLAALQRQFLGRMRGGNDGPAPRWVADDRLSRDVGLRIYAHAYGARLREALEHDHPVLGRCLGDDLWEVMCRGYIATHPSRVRSLRDFGARLPDYLAATAPFDAHPRLAEIARWERRMLDSFDAADGARVDWDALLALPPAVWPTLRPQFHPSVRLHRVAHNSVEAWQAIRAGLPPPPAAVAVSPAWALWRDADRVSRFRSLAAPELAALEHCVRGGSFSGLCERLQAWHTADAVPMQALQLLREWCDAGWVACWVVDATG